MEGFEAVRPNAFHPSLYCLNLVPQLVVSAAADNPLPALGGHCLLSYGTVMDDLMQPQPDGVPLADHGAEREAIFCFAHPP